MKIYVFSNQATWNYKTSHNVKDHIESENTLNRDDDMVMLSRAENTLNRDDDMVMLSREVLTN